ncbi:unnamed protein product [Prorocentrum cordatum]|uniref:Uncharacterized protein n=1 Tax=Prorocentrum cordatum TaxID=2364126 RepID=A0ABN9QUE1_9DINO|nr:unnamed protein product [Polarella glacialis]
MLDAPATIPEVVGTNMTAIKKLVEDFNACEKPEDAEQPIRVGRIAKTAQDDQVKLILGIQSLGDRRSPLLGGLRQLGGRHLRGAAPPGYMEENLQEWTDGLEGHVQ